MRYALIPVVLSTVLFLEWSCNGGHSVGMTWKPSTASGVEYKVYRSQSSQGPYSLIAAGLTDTKYVDSTVTPGTYYYAVTAYYPACQAGCESDYSNQIAAVVPQ